MDIFEQIEKIIRNMETKERKSQTGLLRDQGLVLEQMVKQYLLYVERRQLAKAHDCLERISRLVVAILAE